MSNRLSQRHFWDWFSRHHQEYLTLKNKSKKEASYWLNEMSAHLRAYFKFLGFSIEWRQNKTAMLTITVNGKAKHFKKVDDLIAKAPGIPEWTFTALEIPRPIDFLLEEQIQKTGIDPGEMSFSLVANSQRKILLTVYHPLCSPQNESLIYQLAYNAVYNLLGERSFGTEIADLEVTNLSYADADDIEELEALPSSIGKHLSSTMVDPQGNLVSLNAKHL